MPRCRTSIDEIDRLEPAQGNPTVAASRGRMVHLAARGGPAAERPGGRGWGAARMGLTSLHFLHPAWLLALPPLLLLTVWLARSIANDGNWSRIVDSQLLPLLRVSEGRRARCCRGRARGLDLDIGGGGACRAGLESHGEPGVSRSGFLGNGDSICRRPWAPATSVPVEWLGPATRQPTFCRPRTMPGLDW